MALRVVFPYAALQRSHTALPLLRPHRLSQCLGCSRSTLLVLLPVLVLRMCLVPWEHLAMLRRCLMQSPWFFQNNRRKKYGVFLPCCSVAYHHGNCMALQTLRSLSQHALGSIFLPVLILAVIAITFRLRITQWSAALFSWLLQTAEPT